MSRSLDKTIIDRIRRIRASNNHNWMDILKLALKHAPDDTRTLLEGIINNDRAVCEEIERLIKK